MKCVECKGEKFDSISVMITGDLIGEKDGEHFGFVLVCTNCKRVHQQVDNNTLKGITGKKGKAYYNLPDIVFK